MIKYRLKYRSFNENQWNMDIDVPGYTGDPVTVYSREGYGSTLQFDGGMDDVWDNPVVNVKLLSTLINEGQIDVSELQQLEDRDAKVSLSRNGNVVFTGYLIADQMQWQFVSPPYDVQISATSGLNLLDGITYSGFGAELGARCPLNYYRKILQQQLGISLPIRWSISVSAMEAAISGDAMQNLRWANDGRGYVSYNPATQVYTYQNCRYIIEGITKALQARIVQADGAWWIIGIGEHLKDVITYSECANTTGVPVVSQHTRECINHIGTDYTFIREDSIIMNKPALGAARVKYEHDQRVNIIPNGSFDETSVGFIIDWSVSDSILTAFQADDITGQGGNSVELWNMGDGAEHKFFLSNPLPIDANVLYKNLQWGFSFMAIGGFETEQDGFIKWNNNPIKMSVIYTINDNGVVKDYYLNEFGYWSDKNTAANQEIISATIQKEGTPYVLRVQFSTTKSFFPGDRFNITFMRDGVREFYTHTFTESIDVEGGINILESIIPNSFNPPAPAGNFGISGVDNNPNFSVIMDKAEDYYKYIYFTVDKLKLNDSAAVTFRGAGSLEVKTVDPGPLSGAIPVGVGTLRIEVFVKGGMQFKLDDLWMQVNQNYDMYEATASTKNTKSQDVTLGISSAFSGFKVSNFTRSFHKSNVDWKFTDGISQGSLTELYVRALMRWKYKNSKIFNGTIDTKGKAWSFIDNYTVETLGAAKFVPVNPSYNTETEEVYLIAIEGRNDNVLLDVKHYGSEFNLQA